MIVKAYYSIDSVNTSAYYYMNPKLNVNQITEKIREFYRELTMDTGNTYELNSIDIITKSVIDLCD